MKTNTHVLALALAAFCGSVPAALHAQACALSAGDTARVATVRDATDRSAGALLRPPNYFGTFRSQGPSAITLEADGELLIVPRDAVAGVAGLCAVTTTPGKDGLKRGAIYGAVAGVALGFAYSFACPTDSPGDCGGFIGKRSMVEATLVGGSVTGVLGALFGAFTGSLAGEQRWVPATSLSWP